MKKYIFLAVSALTLASCQTDDFLGDTPGNNPSYAQKSISFGGTTGKISRATSANAAAAGKLGNNLIVFGTKTTVDGTKKVVYDHYNVNYIDGKWIYEGQGSNTILNQTGGKQALKYWDYSASQYDFVAFSLGSNTMGTEDGQIQVTRITDTDSPTYKLQGNLSNLRGCFIANKMSVTNTNFGNPVQFTFSSTGTKVSVNIYEQISGYSIKEIKFYEKDGTTGTSTTPILYAETECIPQSEGTATLTVSFNDKGEAETNWEKDGNSENTSNSSSITFDKFELNVTREDNETQNADDKYIGRTQDKPTSTGEKEVTACTITGGLTMKVDYTLIATDGSGEEITVTGASVNVKEQYTTWQPNFIYKYLFKITADTNGSTGGAGGIQGLKPIVFDAIVTENAEGTKVTETTFDADGNSTTKEITSNTTEGGTTEESTNEGN